MKLCHYLVAETAQAIASEVYEVCATNRRFFSSYPTMASFVSVRWGDFIGDARMCLVAMLQPISNSNPPTYAYSQHARDEIFEALVHEGEMKSSPPLDLNQLREAAGMEPIRRPLPGIFSR